MFGSKKLWEETAVQFCLCFGYGKNFKYQPAIQVVPEKMLLNNWLRNTIYIWLVDPMGLYMPYNCNISARLTLKTVTHAGKQAFCGVWESTW